MIAEHEQYEQILNEKVATARLGIEAESFLTTDVGRRLLECARMEYDDALQRLSTVDPTDTSLIIHLQGMAWRADSVQQWLETIISNGREAEMEIRAMEDTNG